MSTFVEEISWMQKKAFAVAKSKGWWDKTPPAAEAHMLMVTEIAEATEEVRKGTPPIYYTLGQDRFTPEHVQEMLSDGSIQDYTSSWKPEGELIELADVVIRILNYCEGNQWDLGKAIETKMLYNATRPHKHGGKKF
jgi:NTP pyrophosphatase (non-canonical NTP hydrolase)